MITSDFTIKAPDFDPAFLSTMEPIHKKGRRKKSQKEVKYLPLVCAFDIETTTDRKIKQAWMYHWQFQLDRYVTITGRTWEEFTDFLAGLIGALDDKTLVVYVHNLSYEWQFISDPEIYDFSQEEIFAMDTRSILKARIGSSIEFRCSYRLFNQGLGFVTKDYDVKHKKLDGDDYDYNRIRYPWTELTPLELEYCYNDVRGLVESVYALMEAYHDDLITIPLTSTGYPRRDCKKVLYKIRPAIMDQVPAYEIYKFLRLAFRGGDTHASRHWSGLILYNVFSDDRSSSYPAVNANNPYPMSTWHEVDPANLNEDYIVDLMTRRRKALLMKVTIYNLDLRDPDWPAPYLSIDKCHDILWPDRSVDKRPCRDNGRILRADRVTCYITDVDLKIILKEYTGYIDFERCFYARYGNLPRMFIDVINGYYTAKTKLKNVPGQDINYLEAKKKNNGIYGMEATDPIKPTFDYDGTTITMPLLTDDVVGELYQKYQRTAWIPYSWGVWTTAWARYELHRGMWAIAEDPDGGGVMDLIYWDTDSLKHFNPHRKALDKLNKEYIRIAKSNGAYAADPSGEVHYMGVFEQEKTYSRFITYGAKKYAYEYADGEPHVTIAGVNKELGGEELKEKGGLRALKEGFTFRKAGGTESYYNDTVPPEYQMIRREGMPLHITKNIALLPSTYRLGITADYQEILEDGELWRKMLDDDVIYRYTKRRSVKS